MTSRRRLLQTALAAGLTPRFVAAGRPDFVQRHFGANLNLSAAPVAPRTAAKLWSGAIWIHIASNKVFDWVEGTGWVEVGKIPARHQPRHGVAERVESSHGDENQSVSQTTL